MKLMPKCNDIAEFKDSRRACHDLNLEKELNDPELLKRIHADTFNLIGISPQPLNADLLVEKEGVVILQYASEKIIDARKIVTLLSQHSSKAEVCKILGRTAICLMEQWGLLQGGIKVS